MFDGRCWEFLLLVMFWQFLILEIFVVEISKFDKMFSPSLCLSPAYCYIQAALVWQFLFFQHTLCNLWQAVGREARLYLLCNSNNLGDFFPLSSLNDKKQIYFSSFFLKSLQITWKMMIMAYWTSLLLVDLVYHMLYFLFAEACSSCYAAIACSSCYAASFLLFVFCPICCIVWTT